MMVISFDLPIAGNASRFKPPITLPYSKGGFSAKYAEPSNPDSSAVKPMKTIDLFGCLLEKVSAKCMTAAVPVALSTAPLKI